MSRQAHCLLQTWGWQAIILTSKHRLIEVLEVELQVPLGDFWNALVVDRVESLLTNNRQNPPSPNFLRFRSTIKLDRMAFNLEVILDRGARPWRKARKACLWCPRMWRWVHARGFCVLLSISPLHHCCILAARYAGLEDVCQACSFQKRCTRRIRRGKGALFVV